MMSTIRNTRGKGVSRLIENAIEKTELILAAQAITDKLQKMAEELAKVEADDVMPMLDSLTTSFGPQVSTNFSTVCSTQIRATIEAITVAKTGISAEIARLESAVNGGGSTDMAMDVPPPAAVTPPPPPAPDAVGADASLPAAGGDALPPPPDEEEPVTNDFSGRVKKESFNRRGRRLYEGSRGNPELAAALMSLEHLHPDVAATARSIETQIDALDHSGNERSALESLLLSVASMEEVDDVEDVIDSLISSHGIDIRIPACKKIVGQIKKLAHHMTFSRDTVSEEPMMAPISAPMGMNGMPMIESRGVKALRESSNPDGLVLATFRALLSESKLGAAGSAQHTAKTFGIDFSDVVAIIREAKKLPPAFLKNIKKSGGKGKEDDKTDDKKSENPFAKKDEKKKVDEDFSSRLMKARDKGGVVKSGPAKNAPPSFSEKSPVAPQKRPEGFKSKFGRNAPRSELAGDSKAPVPAMKGSGKAPSNVEPETTKTPNKMMKPDSIVGNPEPPADKVTPAKKGSITLFSTPVARGMKNESAKKPVLPAKKSK